MMDNEIEKKIMEEEVVPSLNRNYDFLEEVDAAMKFLCDSADKKKDRVLFAVFGEVTGDHSITMKEFFNGNIIQLASMIVCTISKNEALRECVRQALNNDKSVSIKRIEQE